MVGLDLSLSLYKACPLTPIFYCNTVIFFKRRYSSWSNSQGVLSSYQESTLKTMILSYFLFWVCQIQSYHGFVYCTLQVRICLYWTILYGYLLWLKDCTYISNLLHCKCLQGITGSLQGFTLLGNPVLFTGCGEIPWLSLGLLQSLNITGFIHIPQHT